MLRPLRPSLLLVFAAATSSPRTSLASNVDTFGSAPEDIARVGAVTASASDGTSAFYNPSGLAFSKNHHLLVSGLGHVSFLRRQGTRAALESAPAISLAAASSTPWQPLRLGLLVQAPGATALRLHAASVEQPMFAMYEHRLERLVVIPALAVGLGTWSVGLALDGSAGVSASVDIAEDSSRAPATTMVQRAPVLGSPIVGLSWEPTRKIRLSLVYRHEFSIPVRVHSNIELAGVNMTSRVEATELMFEPSTVTAGACVHSETLTVELDLSHRRWSTWTGPWVNMTADVSALSLRRPQGQAVFQDTWGARVGLSQTIHESSGHEVRLLGGFGYETSMLSEQQQGITNVIDAPKWLMGLGARSVWRDVLGLELSTSLGVQLHSIGSFGQSKKLCAQGPCSPDELPASSTGEYDNPGYPVLQGGGSVIVTAWGMGARW